MHTKFQSGKLKGKHNFGDLGTDRKIILKWIIGKQDVKGWAGLNWMRTVSNYRLLWTW